MCGIMSDDNMTPERDAFCRINSGAKFCVFPVRTIGGTIEGVRIQNPYYKEADGEKAFLDASNRLFGRDFREPYPYWYRRLWKWIKGLMK